MTHGKNKVVEKDGPNLFKKTFNCINQKAAWKGHMAELVLLKNNARFFFKLKILKIDTWHLNLPHGKICVIEIDGLDLLLVGF
jgi:hypothetical protein